MAKEKFEDRKLTGAINVCCKFDDGSIKWWRTRKEDVVANIISIVDEYAAEGYILTLRQLHYQFVGHVEGFINHITAYKKLGDIVDDCRYSGTIDWGAIEDRGRVPYIPYSVNSVEHALQDTIDQYRLDRQEGQSNHVELWSEKDALAGILRRSTEKYHIQLIINKGYSSSSAMYSAYNRILNNSLHEGMTTILYFGDHDPSGLDMVRDISERLTFMIEQGEYHLVASDIFQIIQIGLTMQQIKKYKLPPNPTKLTDSRSDKYIAKFGKTCWEVDALKPQVLTSIIESHIQQQIDVEKYKEMVTREKGDIEELENFIRTR